MDAADFNMIKGDGKMSKNEKPMQYLKVSENRRFLVKEDGTPFFWLGDTAWELFHRYSREEADLYLTNRAGKKFTVIQAVALAEMDGIRTENAHGRKPLLLNSKGEYDPALPDLTGTYHYWDHVDYIVNRAEELGLYIAMLPTWGDKYNMKWGKGPIIFNKENAFVYGRWLGNRYKDKPNIVWVLGGDRPLEDPVHYDIVCAMAHGLREGDGGQHLITYHPWGESSSSQYVHNEEWLDFNMIQSGHGYDWDNYRRIKADYDKIPVKPVVDGEPRYEDHPINFKPKNGYYNDADVRQGIYWGVFAGGFGITYGHHCIWCKNTEPGDYFIMDWKEALDRPAGSQVQYIRALIESRPFLERVPDQSLLYNVLAWENHLQATRGDDYAFIYSPTGQPIDVNMGKISGEKVKAYWYDPRNGSAQYIGEYPNEGVATFVPPSSGKGNDWVLVLDDAAKNYPSPGSKTLF